MSIIKITSDLGFGDCGKGTIVSALCRKYGQSEALVVRYNGGAQACHAVQSGSIRHQFHMLGSGTLEGASTLLSEYVLVDPVVLYEETVELKKKLGIDVCGGLFIDPRCLITTTYHKLVNQARESVRGTSKHGSCGMGIGATVEYNEFTPDAIRVQDLITNSTVDLRNQLQLNRLWASECINKLNAGDIDLSRITALLSDEEEFEAQLSVFPNIIERHIIADGLEVLNDFHIDNSPIIFEASQGILLDQDWGFHPYTTWSRTVAENAYQLLDDANIDDEVENIGIMRAYQTRHGAGPLPTETTKLGIVDANNPTNNWQDNFRVGYLDLVLTSYAIHANDGIDSLAVTCLDQLKESDLKVCVAYDKVIKHNNPGDLYYLEQLGKELNQVEVGYLPILEKEKYVSFISEYLEVPISILSNGADTANKKFLSCERI